MTTWEIHLQRVYDAIEPGPGRFVLVDRVWPRGIRKQALPVRARLRGCASVALVPLQDHGDCSMAGQGP